jgi:predicted ATPase
MITNIHLKNFKSHKSTHIELGALTFLCGQNGVGKSSLVQSLLLLRQTYLKHILEEGLDLNKPLCEIGTARDLLYQKADENQVEIRLKFDNQLFKHWKFDYNKPIATFLDVAEKADGKADLKIQGLFNKKFQYLSAGRLAPQESYPKNDYEVERNRQISLEKGQGELVAHFLYHYGSKYSVPESMCNPNDDKYKELLYQVTAWEREICKNVQVKVENKGRGFELKYDFEAGDNLPITGLRPENVGFGVTYTLPILAAILAAEPGSLIIIENPEAHLHPAGQSKLAALMSLAAQAGIQILVETHSDHIINGALVALKQRKIDLNKIKIHYFDRDETEHAVSSIEVEVLKGGRIRNAPDGFFDQFGKDLRILMAK